MFLKSIIPMEHIKLELNRFTALLDIMVLSHALFECTNTSLENYSPQTAKKITGNNYKKVNRLYKLLYVIQCPETNAISMG